MARKKGATRGSCEATTRARGSVFQALSNEQGRKRVKTKIYIKKFMLTSNFYNLLPILVTLGLLRLSLSKSGLNTLLTTSLGCGLSFCIFENPLTFFPIVLCLLKDQIEYSFLFLKKILADLRGFFPFGKSQEEKKQVLAEQVLTMDKRDEGQTSNPENDQTNTVDSSCMEKQEVSNI